MLASNIALTVAHQIYSQDNETLFHSLIFNPGVSGNLNQVKGHEVITYYSPKDYKNVGSDFVLYDYALLKISRNVKT